MSLDPVSVRMLSQHLCSVGEARGLAVHVQRQDIFDAMHRI